MTAEVLRRRAGIDSIDIDGDTLVFDGETLSRLTGSASLVLRAIDGVSTREQVADRVAAGFPSADSGRVVSDVLQLIAELESAGVVDSHELTGTRFRRADGVGYAYVDGGIALADLDSGRRWALDERGALVWELLLEHGSVDHVIASLDADIGDEEQLHRDVTSLIDELVQAGLLLPHP